ncbi:hypothetical protein HDU96_004924 [Phlyctochytrium bullatum]|nr:hypothetical protein HDU96_004924 [Phlyctochytrium bullatum]
MHHTAAHFEDIYRHLLQEDEGQQRGVQPRSIFGDGSVEDSMASASTAAHSEFVGPFSGDLAVQQLHEDFLSLANQAAAFKSLGLMQHTAESPFGCLGNRLGVNPHLSQDYPVSADLQAGGVGTDVPNEFRYFLHLNNQSQVSAFPGHSSPQGGLPPNTGLVFLPSLRMLMSPLGPWPEAPGLYPSFSHDIALDAGSNQSPPSPAPELFFCGTSTPRLSGSSDVSGMASDASEFSGCSTSIGPFGSGFVFPTPPMLASGSVTGLRGGCGVGGMAEMVTDCVKEEEDGGDDGMSEDDGKREQLDEGREEGNDAEEESLLDEDDEPLVMSPGLRAAVELDKRGKGRPARRDKRQASTTQPAACQKDDGCPSSSSFIPILDFDVSNPLTEDALGLHFRYQAHTYRLASSPPFPALRVPFLPPSLLAPGGSDEDFDPDLSGSSATGTAEAADAFLKRLESLVSYAGASVTFAAVDDTGFGVVHLAVSLFEGFEVVRVLGRIKEELVKLKRDDGVRYDDATARLQLATQLLSDPTKSSADGSALYWSKLLRHLHAFGRQTPLTLAVRLDNTDACRTLLKLLAASPWHPGDLSVSPSFLQAAAAPPPLRLPRGWIPAVHVSARDVEKRARGKKVAPTPKRKRDDDSVAAWIRGAAARVAGWHPGAAFREIGGARVPGERGNMVTLWDGALAPVHVAVEGGKTEALRVLMAATDRDPVNDGPAHAGEGSMTEAEVPDRTEVTKAQQRCRLVLPCSSARPMKTEGASDSHDDCHGEEDQETPKSKQTVAKRASKRRKVSKKTKGAKKVEVEDEDGDKEEGAACADQVDSISEKAVSSLSGFVPCPIWWWWWSAEDEHGITPLHRAIGLQLPIEEVKVSGGQPRLVLLFRDALTIYQNVINTILVSATPLSPTVLNAKFQDCPPLLMRNRQGYTPLLLAILLSSTSIDLIRFLLDHPTSQREAPPALAATIRTHWDSAVSRCSGVAYGEDGSSGMSALTVADAGLMLPDVVMERNALHWTCAVGRLDLVKELVEVRGCAVAMKDARGHDALGIAMRAGQVAVADYLQTRMAAGRRKRRASTKVTKVVKEEDLEVRDVAVRSRSLRSKKRKPE